MGLYLFLSFVDPHVKSYFGPLGLVVLSGARMVLAMATGSATFLSLADCWLLTFWGVSMHFGGYSPASTYAESPSVIKTNKQTNGSMPVLAMGTEWREARMAQRCLSL